MKSRLKYRIAALLTAIAVFLWAQKSHAEFEWLPKDSPSPYSGYLISPGKEQELRLNNEKLKLNDAIIKQYEIVKTLDDKHIGILQQRLDIYQNENIRLSKEVVESRGDGFWNKFLYFALGAAATTAIAYGVSHATR